MIQAHTLTRFCSWLQWKRENAKQQPAASVSAAGSPPPAPPASPAPPPAAAAAGDGSDGGDETRVILCSPTCALTPPPPSAPTQAFAQSVSTKEDKEALTAIVDGLGEALSVLKNAKGDGAWTKRLVMKGWWW